MVPPVSVITVEMLKKDAGLGDDRPGALQPDRYAIACSAARTPCP